ncbi:MAG TPA: hypothetical protein VF779_01035 [Pyrinomonadaceae bacterium]
MLCLLSLMTTAGRERKFLHTGNPSFVERAETKAEPQAKRKRSSKRRGAVTSKSSTTTTQSTTPQQPALPTSQGPLSQIHYELPIRKPGAGESQARGLLERVDCNGNVATFIVHADQGTLKLHATNFNAVQYRTYTPDVSGDITCGARNPASPVVVTFRPSKDARSKFNGDVIAVEFVPKDFELKK